MGVSGDPLSSPIRAFYETIKEGVPGCPCTPEANNIDPLTFDETLADACEFTQDLSKGLVIGRLNLEQNGMPLFRQNPWKLAPPPTDITDKERFFVMRFTNEIFRTYSEYIESFERYRQRIWTCSATGRKNLTFEEALLSEQKAEQANKCFPDRYLLPLLLLVQHKQDSLDELVDTAHEHYQTHYFPGEVVEYRAKGSPSERVEIVSVDKQDKTEKYKVKLYKEEEEKDEEEKEKDEEEKKEDKVGEVDGAYKIVTAGSLFRKRPPLTKPVIRRMIKVTAERDTYKGAPWTIREAYTNRFPEIPTELPSRLQQLLDERSQKKRKRPSEGIVDDNKEGSAKRPTRKVSYDLDDLDVSARNAATKPPLSCSIFLVAKEYVGDLLVVWNFLVAFGKVLKLAPFTFDDFERAITYEENTVTLVDEVHIRLLKMLRKRSFTSITWFEGLLSYFVNVEKELQGEIGEEEEENEEEGGSSSSTSKKTSGNRKGASEDSDEESGGEEGIRGRKAHLGTDSSVVPSIIKSLKKYKKYHKLSQKKKIAILRFLCDDALDTEAMRKALEENLASLTELKKQHREKEAELMRKLKEERRDDEDDKKKHVQSMEALLEKQATKHSLRTTPLGLDRHHNHYWFFPLVSDRVFVEKAKKEHGDIWGYYSTVDELDALLEYLDVRGVREKVLRANIEKKYQQICSAIKERDHQVALRTLEVRRSTRIKNQEKEKEERSFLTYVNTYLV